MLAHRANYRNLRPIGIGKKLNAAAFWRKSVSTKSPPIGRVDRYEFWPAKRMKQILLYGRKPFTRHTNHDAILIFRITPRSNNWRKIGSDRAAATNNRLLQNELANIATSGREMFARTAAKYQSHQTNNQCETLHIVHLVINSYVCEILRPIRAAALRGVNRRTLPLSNRLARR